LFGSTCWMMQLQPVRMVLELGTPWRTIKLVPGLVSVFTQYSYRPGLVSVFTQYSYSRNPTISPLPLKKIPTSTILTHSTPRKMGFQIWVTRRRRVRTLKTTASLASETSNDVFIRSIRLYPRGRKSLVTSCLILQKTSNQRKPSIGFRHCALTVKSLLLLAREVSRD
jgi:hypothetical protein